MISLIIGVLWGLAVIGISFTSAIKPGGTSVVVALAGLGLIAKSYTIFVYAGGA